MLHKNKLGISAENIIKMFDIADAGQKAEKRPLFQNVRCNWWDRSPVIRRCSFVTLMMLCMQKYKLLSVSVV